MSADIKSLFQPAIYIWEWESAPDNLRVYSTHGGDEDGVIFVPKGVEEPWWLERLWSHYGEPDRVELETGTVLIWAHA